MKLKLSLGSDGIKGFLFAHVEKILLTLVVLLSAALVMKGYQRETTKVTPQSMEQLANRAQQKMEETEWDDVSQDRVQLIDFRKKAEGVQQPVPIASYEFGLLRPFLQMPDIKRTDPKLLAVIDLEVTGGFAPLAIRMGRDELENRNEEEGLLRRRFSRGLGDINSERRGPRERPLTPDERRKFEGSHQSRRFGGRPRAGGPGGGGRSSKAVGHAFVALRGLVPVKEQLAIYETCFGESEALNQRRDIPSYLYYKLRRRTLGADGKVGEWKKILTNGSTLFINEWAGFTPEIADPEFLVRDQKEMSRRTVGPGSSDLYGKQWIGLVWPLPPLLLRDITPFALHTKVPRRITDRRGMRRSGWDENEPTKLKPEDVKEEDALNAHAGGNFRSHPGLPLEGGHRMRGGSIQELPEYYLFRFFDFQVEPGKKYQYQVKLFLDDPNNPANRDRAPSNQSLAQDVIDRILKQRAVDKKASRRQRTYHRETEWSDVSSWVHVPDGRDIFLGTPSKIATVSLGDFEYARKPPEMEVMAVVWDENEARDVAATSKVTRGTIVNFLGENIDAVDPAEAVRIPIKEYYLETDVMVADLRGGKELPGKQSELLEPGEMLLVDKFGNFAVRNELDDHPLYARYVLEDQDSELPGIRIETGEDGDNRFGDGFSTGRRGRGANTRRPGNRRSNNATRRNR